MYYHCELAICRTFLLFVLCSLAGCSDPVSTVERALQYEREGDTRAAVVELKSVIQQNPSDPDARFLLGRLYNAAFDPVSAEKELKKAIELGLTGDTSDALIQIAQAQFRQGKYDELLAAGVPDVISSGDKRATMIALLGLSELSLGNLSNATENLKLAQQAASDNPQTGFLDAHLKIREGDIEGAESAIAAVLATEPDNLFAQLFKAELFRASRRDEEALEAYGQALAIHPKSLEARARRSSLLVRRGQLDDGLEDAKTLTKFYPDNPESNAVLGFVQLARGDAQAALDAARAALKIAPEHPKATFLLGMSQRAKGELLQAAQSLRDYVRARPGHIYSRRVLADVLINLKQPAEALQALDPILKSQVVKDSKSYVLAGIANRALGQETEAIKWFEKAAEIEPDDPETLLHRAITSIGIGDVEAGLDDLEGLVETTNDASAADEILVLTLVRQGEIERAESKVTDLVNRAPDSPLSHHLRGMVMIVKGDQVDARNAFEQALALDSTFLPAARNLEQMDLLEGNSDAARERYRMMINSAPTNVAVMRALADLSARVGDREEAITVLKQAVRAEPDSVEPVTKLVALYLESNRNQEAADLSRTLLDKNETNSRIIELAARSSLAAGTNNQANEIIKGLLNLPDKSAENYIKVAKLQFLARLPREAEQTLNRALKIYPASAPTHIALVAMLVDLRRSDDAMAHAKTVQSLLAGPLGELLQGEILESTGDYDEAIAAYQRALDIQPIGQIAVKRFVAHTRAGDSAQALTELKSWVDEHPEDFVARLRLADAFVAQKDYRTAIEYYESLKRNKVISLGGLNSLAWAYYSIGDPQALAVAENAYRVAPKSGYIADTLGWILVENGDLERGLPILRRAANMAPHVGEIRFHLGAALLKAGDKKAARIELEKAAATEGANSAKEDALALLNTLDEH